MKNKLKNICILLILITLTLSLFTESYCDDDITDIITKMEGVDTSTGVSSGNKLVKGVNVIYTIIRVVGTGIALLMVMFLGIKYMMTSVEEKAEIKKQAIPILVGSALIFATSNILSIVVKIVEE